MRAPAVEAAGDNANDLFALPHLHACQPHANEAPSRGRAGRPKTSRCDACQQAKRKCDGRNRSCALWSETVATGPPQNDCTAPTDDVAAALVSPGHAPVAQPSPGSLLDAEARPGGAAAACTPSEGGPSTDILSAGATRREVPDRKRTAPKMLSNESEPALRYQATGKRVKRAHNFGGDEEGEEAWAQLEREEEAEEGEEEAEEGEEEAEEREEEAEEGEEEAEEEEEEGEGTRVASESPRPCHPTVLYPLEVDL